MTETKKIKVRKITYDQQKLIWAIIFLLPWIIGFLFLFLIPMINSFRYSFFHVEASPDGGFITTWVGFRNYYNALRVEAIGNTIFQVEVIDTITEVAINIPVILIFSLFIATVLNQEFRGRAIARAIFFLPVILNSAAVTAALATGQAVSNALSDEGAFSVVFALNDYLLRAGLGPNFVNFIGELIGRIYSILSYSGVPILLFLAGIQSIPKHLYEAAEIEGATSYEMFWLITLPNIKVHFLTVSIFILIDHFMTSPIAEYIDMLKQTQWGLKAAMSWLYVLVILSILAVLLIVSKVFKWGESHYDAK